MSASVRAIQGYTARFPLELGPIAHPFIEAGPHSPNRASRRTLQAAARRLLEVAAGQDRPLRTEGLAASVAACRTSQLDEHPGCSRPGSRDCKRRNPGQGTNASRDGRATYLTGQRCRASVTALIAARPGERHRPEPQAEGDVCCRGRCRSTAGMSGCHLLVGGPWSVGASNRAECSTAGVPPGRQIEALVLRRAKPSELPSPGEARGGTSDC